MRGSSRYLVLFVMRLHSHKVYIAGIAPAAGWLAEKAHPLGRKLLEGLSVLATPETILGWYRKLIAANYDGSNKRGAAGHPKARGLVIETLLTLARETPTWGYTRLRGALDHLGYQLGRNTIARVLAEHGIEPAPSRGTRMSWSTFLALHAEPRGLPNGCNKSSSPIDHSAQSHTPSSDRNKQTRSGCVLQRSYQRTERSRIRSLYDRERKPVFVHAEQIRDRHRLLRNLNREIVFVTHL